MGLEAVTYLDDLNVANPTSSDPRSEGDDHFRNLKLGLKNTFPGLAGRSWRVQTKASGYTLVANDNMTVIRCSAAITLAITAAATLGNGYVALIEATSGDVVIDPAASEQVNGATSVTLASGHAAVLSCDGSAFKLFMLPYVGSGFSVVGALSLTGVASPAQITADTNDYAPTGFSAAATLRISADARRTLTGLAAGTVGRQITIHNVGEYPIVFAYENASSTAANRFAFGHVLSGGHTMKLEYDATSSRWRCTYKQLPAGTSLDHMGSTVPAGTLAEDGSAVSRTTYAALFREISTTHGVGDGSTTFNLPDTRRRTLVGSGGTGTGTLGNAVGNTGGAETHTLAISEMPSHDHPGGTIETDNAGPGAATAVQRANESTSKVNVSKLNMAAQGGGGAHNNLQPSLVVTKVIVF